jgi:hypothetical protein
LTGPLDSWLRQYTSKTTKDLHRADFGLFCEWTKTTDEELVEEYKNSDPREFSKKWGKALIQYFKDCIKEGLKINSARTRLSAPRAFFKSQCVGVQIK